MAEHRRLMADGIPLEPAFSAGPKWVIMWQQRAGLGNSPRTVLEEIARIQSNDVVLPTATHGNIRLRCITQPDPAHAMLLERLGVVLPKRMRLNEIVRRPLPARSLIWAYESVN